MTERVSQRFCDLDQWPSVEAVEAMYEGQLAALAATKAALKDIAHAADQAAARLGADGRLIYAGAGTSGRLAVQDGVELGPTYGWPADRLLFCLAGGMAALTQSVEDAEDHARDGRRAIREAGTGGCDVVIGVAASGNTPFTLGVLEEAKASGALTIAIANNANTPILQAAHCPILAETGSELVAGSTRMKAGTAQKAILNMLSTAIMLRLGRIYKGFMVNMVISNKKLRARAINMVCDIAGCRPETADKALDAADGDIKLAVLICLGHDPASSRDILARAQGNLRVALAAQDKAAQDKAAQDKAAQDKAALEKNEGAVGR